MTQMDMAARLGCNQSTVCGYERGGDSLTLKTLKKYADTLGYTVTIQLVGDNNETINVDGLL